jgi:hypothetical protein
MNEPTYRESIKNAAEFNSRLSQERTQRLPFLDHITGKLCTLISLIEKQCITSVAGSS